jgi:25S rRNA (uracil2634-N3)-methyltransferase
VGDGDFSFSLCLTTNLRREDMSDEFKAIIVASSYESQDVVIKTYPGARSTLSALSSAGVRVLHDIDARKLHEYASINSEDFNVIVWNFPCKGVPAGFDGQVNEIEENRDMLQSFFKTCGEILKPKGEVHITHKTLEPFSWWKIAEIAESYGWIHECSVIFDKYVYPGYKNCKALDKKSFPTSDALVRSHFRFIQTRSYK